ncbi:dihydrofolate reductase-like domain-containing protein [Globomyces pollinis-pini]|nr:dihydrofolate reductase-like domain-containing protein [Globomyces pollinis-pini]KAJ2993068.1 dihydrofolate reductase [Globomyces sp. JEL0801]
MTTSKKVHLIVAATKEGGIGFNGDMPWRLRKDMAYFKKVTTSFVNPSDSKSTTSSSSTKLMNACIMGRKTWDSIPSAFKPLSGRMNIVLSRTIPESQLDNVKYFTTMEDAIVWCERNEIDSVFVIGGGQIYSLALPYTDLLFITRVESPQAIQCDVFLDINMEQFQRVDDGQFKELLPFVETMPFNEGTFQCQFQLWKKQSDP